MLPFKTIIVLDRSIETPLYIQLSNEVIKRITTGIIPVGLKLPGGRKMGEFLGVSRRTVIQAYEELEAQGWIEIKPNQGTFISSKIPITQQKALNPGIPEEGAQARCAFPLNAKLNFLEHYTPPNFKKIDYVFDTGYPDVRLAPLKELSQSFNRVLRSSRYSKIMNYAADFNGHLHLRAELVKYLSQTRGIKCDLDNIIITRGSLMAFTSIFQVLLEPGEKVVVGDISFKVANNIIKIVGGELLTVPVDEQGIDVEAIEKLCQRQRIRAVFVMPHHHHPTTVSLSAERRMKLLMLAAEYQFAIIEDDYDYDFHYASSPILPMASADQNGTVIYVGSFSKTVAPGLRIGFIVAPKDFIRELSRLSRFMDCHGNTALEKALALLFKEGVIRRHLKKSLKAYRLRRDLFCQLLTSELRSKVSFKIPEGGLVTWVIFNDHLPLDIIREKACKQRLLISKTVFRNKNGKPLNAIRMGFASMNEEELIAGTTILKKVIQQF